MKRNSFVIQKDLFCHFFQSQIHDREEICRDMHDILSEFLFDQFCGGGKQIFVRLHHVMIANLSLNCHQFWKYALQKVLAKKPRVDFAPWMTRVTFFQLDRQTMKSCSIKFVNKVSQSEWGNCFQIPVTFCPQPLHGKLERDGVVLLLRIAWDGMLTNEIFWYFWERLLAKFCRIGGRKTSQRFLTVNCRNSKRCLFIAAASSVSQHFEMTITFCQKRIG